MTTSKYSEEQYKQDFLSNPERHAKALERALDTRKFEIELYWKRAGYFWTFIAAALAGFVGVQASSSGNKEDLSVLLACLGMVFSFAWLCVNRGSKFWQENWEYHVDMLEDGINGPLYKVVMTRFGPKNFKEHGVHLITGPSSLSVSKINQLISLFVVGVWVVLLTYSLPPVRLSSPFHWFYCWLVALSVLVCLAFLTLGRSYGGGYWHRATKRSAEIKS